jgi:hypothetical protein
MNDRTRPAARTDRRRKSRGQSLVELALILPVLLVFLAAALDLGRIFYAHVSLRNAAREGALQAAKTPASYVKDQACNTLTNLVTCRVMLEAKGGSLVINATDIGMTCSLAGCPRQAGSLVKVDVRGRFTLVTPLLSAVFGGQSLDFSSTATAQIEYYPDPVVATIPPGPVAGFTVSPDPADGTAPRTIQFTSTSTDATQWYWDFGDGGTTIEESPTHTFTTPGTYTVILTAINITGADVEQKTITITSAASASASASTSAAPSASASQAACKNPPNVVGLGPSEATTQLSLAGFIPDGRGDLTSGPKGKVQAQNPDHTQCLTSQWMSDPTNRIVFHYRPG